MSTESSPAVPITESPDQPKLRSLWGLMHADAPPEPVASVAVTDAPAPKSLWDVMRSGDPEDASSPASALAENPAVVADVEPIASPAQTLPAESHVPIFSPTLVEPKSSALQDWWPVVCGALSIPLSAAAMWPQYWLSLPAAACGFVALVSSAPVWLEASSKSRRRRLATVTAVLGLIGVAAGPVLFAPLGRSLRGTSADHMTQPRESKPEGPRPLGSSAPQNP